MSKSKGRPAEAGEEDVFMNRPVAKAHEYEYQPPPPTSNPVLRGWTLYTLSLLVANSSLVQDVLWQLNGFGKLRDRVELDDVEPRYDPTVIKASSIAPRVWKEGEYLATLNAIDWGAKTPKAQSGAFRSCYDYHQAYASGKFTPVDVVETLLPLVRRDARGKGKGKHSTAFLCVKAEMVRKAAEESAERWRSGKQKGILDGVVMAVKDEEDLTNHTRSLGTTMDFTSATNSTSYAVQKWLDAGAICLGKTSMHEMGMDTTNNNPNHGTPRNPYCWNYYCGGSSGGSAYAVAAGLIPFAMGNDGGGSVRIPAAYCGLFGLKTSHSRISLRPTANLARSTGVAGPIAANMLDLEIAYRVMADPDPEDPDGKFFAPPTGALDTEKKRKILGICRPWFDRADKPVREICYKALDYLEQTCGYEVVDINLPLLDDGQRAHAFTIMTEVLTGCPPPVLAKLTPANRILLSVASRTTSLDFLQAQRLRNLMMQHLAHLYDKHPGLIIVTPTTPNAGWPFQGADLSLGVSDGNTQIRNMEFAYLANFVGCPALSAPVGYLAPEAGKGEGKVPVGLMGMGEWCGEEGLMAFGYAVEGWLHEGLEGGRVEPELRSGRAEDVFELAKQAGTGK